MEINTVIKKWMFSTIRINTEEKNGDKFVETGFLFAKQIDKKHTRVYVVTNRHIVENQVKGTIHFYKDENRTPSPVETMNVSISDFGNHWHHHPILQ